MCGALGSLQKLTQVPLAIAILLVIMLLYICLSELVHKLNFTIIITTIIVIINLLKDDTVKQVNKVSRTFTKYALNYTN